MVTAKVELLPVLVPLAARDSIGTVCVDGTEMACDSTTLFTGVVVTVKAEFKLFLVLLGVYGMLVAVDGVDWPPRESADGGVWPPWVCRLRLRFKGIGVFSITLCP